MGWQEVVFRWHFEKKEDLLECEELYVHIESEGFKGLQMMKEDDNCFELRRVCPPGQVFYFFSRKSEKKYIHFFSSKNLVK
jgi:hypothetical protein